jgi:hypothetical protein
MTRTALSLVLGLGLLGLFGASADAALPYSSSHTNWDGSRTLCGPYGCTTVPSTSLYGRATAYNNSYNRYRSTSFDPYSWDSRTRTTTNRYNDSWYGNSRYDDCRYNDSWSNSSRYNNYNYNHRVTPISRSYDWRNRY